MTKRLSQMMADPPAGISETHYQLNHIKEDFERAVLYHDRLK